MDRNYYKEYFQLEREHWWFRVREQIIIQTIKRFLKLPKDLKILNVGCATGRSTEYLSLFGVVTSVEFDKTCCEFLENDLKISVTQASATDLPFESSSFDLVCAFDVIEHIEDHEKAVQELCRLTPFGGFVFLTVPAFMSIWSKHDIVNHHHRRYLLPELESLFSSKLDGSIRYLTYFNSLLFPSIWLYRKISARLFSKDSQVSLRSDFENPREHKFRGALLYSVFYFEKLLLKFMTFPFGSSAMILWQKKQKL